MAPCVMLFGVRVKYYIFRDKKFEEDKFLTKVKNFRSDR
jgi:hypothetical protein